MIVPALLIGFSVATIAFGQHSKSASRLYYTSIDIKEETMKHSSSADVDTRPMAVSVGGARIVSEQVSVSPVANEQNVIESKPQVTDNKPNAKSLEDFLGDLPFTDEPVSKQTVWSNNTKQSSLDKEVSSVDDLKALLNKSDPNRSKELARHIYDKTKL